ncbi:unnamed protein product [Prunus armeniaca]
MEVYADNMLVKAPQRVDHIKNLTEAFNMLKKYRMKLNPGKCTFGVSCGRFLGYLVTQRGIEALPNQINGILNMKSPATMKEIQSRNQPISFELCKTEVISHFTSHALKTVTRQGHIHLLGGVQLSCQLRTYPRRARTQHPVFYTSKAVLDVETSYLKMDKLILVLCSIYETVKTLLPSSLDYRHDKISFEIDYS